MSVCDVACGMSAHAAVLEALIARGVTGKGRQLEVSLFDGMADWMNVPLLYWEGTGVAPRRVGLAHPSICPYGAFATGDGSLVLVSIQNEREWAAFCAGVLDEPDLALRSGYESNNARVANRPEVDARVGRGFAAMTRQEAAERLRGARIAYGFVNELADLPGHPAVHRVPAQMLNPDSDLGPRLVTRGVAALDAGDRQAALDAGAAVARGLVRSGLIAAAALHLQGQAVVEAGRPGLLQAA